MAPATAVKKRRQGTYSASKPPGTPDNFVPLVTQAGVEWVDPLEYAAKREALGKIDPRQILDRLATNVHSADQGLEQLKSESATKPEPVAKPEPEPATTSAKRTPSKRSAAQDPLVSNPIETPPSSSPVPTVEHTPMLFEVIRTIPASKARHLSSTTRNKEEYAGRILSPAELRREEMAKVRIRRAASEEEGVDPWKLGLADPIARAFTDLIDRYEMSTREFAQVVHLPESLISSVRKGENVTAEKMVRVLQALPSDHQVEDFCNRLFRHLIERRIRLGSTRIRTKDS